MISTPVAIPDWSSRLTPETHLPHRLSAAAEAVSRLVSRAYEERFGLTGAQWSVICILAQGRASLGGLAAATGIEVASVGRSIQDLIRRRLVEAGTRVPEGSDRQFVLSSEGLQAHAAIEPLALAYEAALTSGLAPAEVALLKRLLLRVQTAAQTLGGVGG